jgi:hypothetical protein
MIRKLLNGVSTLFVYGCVATIFAQAIMFVYFTMSWNLTRERWARAVAAAQGFEPENNEVAKTVEEISVEQPSYDQILQARTVKYRNLEIREQELHNGVSQLQLDQNKLADDKKQYKKVRDSFDVQLAALGENSQAAGKEEFRRTMESIKPEQAKELIAAMLDHKEIDDVVELFDAMTDKKRGNIIAQFESPEDQDKIGEVLRRIRKGLPKASVAEAAHKQLGQIKSGQP